MVNRTWKDVLEESDSLISVSIGFFVSGIVVWLFPVRPLYFIFVGAFCLFIGIISGFVAKKKLKEAKRGALNKDLQQEAQNVKWKIHP